MPPTIDTMKLCANFLFIFWTLTVIRSENKILDKSMLEIDHDIKIFENDTESNENINHTDSMKMKNEENIRNPIQNYLKSNLDVFNPQKIELFLNMEGDNISNVCYEKLNRYLIGLREGESWAIKSK